MTHCLDCHGADVREAGLNLGDFTSVSKVVEDFRRWELVRSRLKAEEMPPEEAERHPTLDQRQAVIAWSRALRQYIVDRAGSDPGPVLARRLSGAEYNYTVRDLTGVDIRPAREFPVDPANEAGFDNSGESLRVAA